MPTTDEIACEYLLSHYLAGPSGVPNVSFSRVLCGKDPLTAPCERRFYKAVIKELGSGQGLKPGSSGSSELPGHLI